MPSGLIITLLRKREIVALLIIQLFLCGFFSFVCVKLFISLSGMC